MPACSNRTGAVSTTEEPAAPQWAGLGGARIGCRHPLVSRSLRDAKRDLRAELPENMPSHMSDCTPRHRTGHALPLLRAMLDLS